MTSTNTIETSKETVEDIGCGWIRVSAYHESEDYSVGFKGVVDAVKAWWSGEDRTRYQNSYTFSVCLKPEVKVDHMHGATVERTSTDESN